jgi:hypothetical protein
MTIKLEVVGMKADRFRAYAFEKMLRKPRREDISKRAAEGKPDYKLTDRIRYDVEEVVLEGPVTGTTFTVDAKDKTITRMAFYTGPVEEEVCVGGGEVNATGKIDIEMIEPVDPSEGEIFDE